MSVVGLDLKQAQALHDALERYLDAARNWQEHGEQGARGALAARRALEAYRAELDGQVVPDDPVLKALEQTARQRESSMQALQQNVDQAAEAVNLLLVAMQPMPPPLQDAALDEPKVAPVTPSEPESAPQTGEPVADVAGEVGMVPTFEDLFGDVVGDDHAEVVEEAAPVESVPAESNLVTVPTDTSAAEAGVPPAETADVWADLLGGDGAGPFGGGG
jgi:hypothetical protein